MRSRGRLVAALCDRLPSRTARAVYLASLLTGLAGTAHAQQRSFTVGVENIDYYPLYGVRARQYAGYARDLLDAFAERYGYRFEYVVLPVRRLNISYLKDRKLDFRFPDNPVWSPELRGKERLVYSDSVIEVIEGTMVRREKLGQGLNGLKFLGTILGFTPTPYLGTIAQGNLVVRENHDFQGLIKQTLLGRVDGAYINVAMGEAILKNQLGQPGALVFDPSLPYVKSQFSLSTMKHAAQIREFNLFLAQERELQRTLCRRYAIDCSSTLKEGPAR